MARLFSGAASQRLSGSVDLSAYKKIAMAFWLYVDSYAPADQIAFEFTASVTTQAGSFVINPDSSIAANVFEWIDGDGASGYNAGTFPQASAAAWHHYVLCADRGQGAACHLTHAWVDGVAQTITQSRSTSFNDNYANATLNFMVRQDNVTLPCAGRLADVALWVGVALTQDDVNALYAGRPPYVVQRSALRDYWPVGGEADVVAGASPLTILGTSLTAHPTTIAPPPAAVGAGRGAMRGM